MYTLEVNILKVLNTKPFLKPLMEDFIIIEAFSHPGTLRRVSNECTFLVANLKFVSAVNKTVTTL
jgi:hypothetical protein